jgi:hypothetical protein
LSALLADVQAAAALSFNWQIACGLHWQMSGGNSFHVSGIRFVVG